MDHAARTVITRAGFGKYFIHAVGHGLGLNIHEAPWIGPQSSDELHPGNVFTIEPGIYLPGKGGVRMEDDVVITDDGSDVLTTSSRELLILE